jgi:uncharacterized surface protein with fasciclin (FAS1) repeats
MPGCNRPKKHQRNVYRYYETNLYSLPETLECDPLLSTLYSLICQTGLTSTLSKKGPFTILAPVNAAWTNLSPALQGALQNKATLKQVLLYHVLPGIYHLTGPQLGPTLATLNGAPVTLGLGTNGQLILNNSAQVLGQEIPATNGVVYMIDRVLIPPNFNQASMYQPTTVTVPPGPVNVGPPTIFGPPTGYPTTFGPPTGYPNMAHPYAPTSNLPSHLVTPPPPAIGQTGPTGPVPSHRVPVPSHVTPAPVTFKPSPSAGVAANRPGKTMFGWFMATLIVVLIILLFLKYAAIIIQ